MPYRYLLVTNFANHWEHLDYNSSSYPLRMLKGDTASSNNLFVDNTPTTFVRLDPQTGQPEAAWQGTVYDFRTNTARVYFKVHLAGSLPLSADYERSPGFYVYQIEDRLTQELVNPNASSNLSPDGEPGVEIIPQQTGLNTATVPNLRAVGGTRVVQSDMRPAIFDDLLQTNDWRKFESYTYFLIKLLGIHNAYRFEPDEQSGKADGFFKFGNLAVLYDCTLRTSFEEMKRTQIDNYCKQLEAGTIEAASQPRIIEAFHHHQKQVWIITRGQDRLIETRNDIAVKEVNVERLINLYEFRLRNAFGANQLENELRSIELAEN